MDVAIRKRADFYAVLDFFVSKKLFLLFFPVYHESSSINCAKIKKKAEKKMFNG